MQNDGSGAEKPTESIDWEHIGRELLANELEYIAGELHSDFSQLKGKLREDGDLSEADIEMMNTWAGRVEDVSEEVGYAYFGCYPEELLQRLANK